jgi:hypothetical protein
MFVLHIGVPKTGTTFLQQQVFARATDAGFVHRRQNPEAAALCRNLRRYVRSGSFAALLHRRRARNGMAALADKSTQPGNFGLLISDEGITLQPGQFWRGEGPGPRQVAQRIACLLPSAQIRVVIGIRRQDQWLASRYAESSKDLHGLDQSDFDRRMREIARCDVLDGPLAWLDYAAVRKEFSAALGAENLLLVPLEWIGARPEETIRQLEDFVGLTRVKAGTLKASRQARNPLSKGPNTWRMRQGGKTLHLSPEIEAVLCARFAASNAALAQDMPAPFGA